MSACSAGQRKNQSQGTDSCCRHMQGTRWWTRRRCIWRRGRGAKEATWLGRRTGAAASAILVTGSAVMPRHGVPTHGVDIRTG
jgi:hypothetical protein